MTPSEVVDVDDLRDIVRLEAKPAGTDNEKGTLREFKETSERAFLVGKLRENGWNISKTAEVIGTPRSNLYKKLEQYRHHAGNGRITSAAGDQTIAVRRRRVAGLPVRGEGGREAEGRKVRTPKGSAPGNARSGQPEGKWHRKYTARYAGRFAGGPLSRADTPVKCAVLTGARFGERRG